LEAVDTVEIDGEVALDKVKKGTCIGGCVTKVRYMLLKAEGVKRL
jgi:hypothetical protein